MREELPIGRWVDVAARLDAGGVVPRWAELRSELQGLGCVDDLAAAWRSPERATDVCAALVWLAAADGGDDADATLLLVHLCAGVVWRLVRSLGDLCSDVAMVATGELAAQIRSYRWRTRTGSLLTSLYYDTRRALLTEFAPQERPVEHVPVMAESDTADDAEDVDMIDLLTWAITQGVDETDARLLLEVEREPSRARCSVVAARHGISTRRLLQRRTRALTALQTLAPRYLAEVA